MNAQPVQGPAFNPQHQKKKRLRRQSFLIDFIAIKQVTFPHSDNSSALKISLYVGNCKLRFYLFFLNFNLLP
jgi:hypothetical protein